VYHNFYKQLVHDKKNGREEDVYEDELLNMSETEA
jgi:hypothetical protein